MPDELLAAEDVWGGDIMFIKRPTRYYCVSSATCMEGAGEETTPVALPSGVIVSEAEIPRNARSHGEDGISTMRGARRRNGGLLYLSPKTPGHAEVAHRIFIT
ncbi:unnamed protein product [Phytomonas sp. EM1]|nr:unnamed protein product [Phytomonas sp. EM1]|eukprot:CCW60583.1 unnamed protein product [Phytomonas sp. isolate EM1]